MPPYPRPPSRPPRGGRLGIDLGRRGRAACSEISGSKAAPEVRVTGPGGQSLQTPAASGFVRRGCDPDPPLRPPTSHRDRTAERAARRLRDQPLPGSAPITSFGRASDPPNARVVASVRGTGTHRVLVYDVRRRPNQRVTFAEVGAGGSSRTIGTVAGGGRGELHFSPAPGRGTRRIVAQFELAGSRRRPGPSRASRHRRRSSRRRGGLSIQHSGDTLRVRWSTVPAAATYQVSVTPTDGLQHTIRTRGRHVTIRAVAAYVSGTASVRALAPLRDGRAAIAHFRATRSRPTSLRPLAHCSGTAKLVCSSTR